MLIVYRGVGSLGSWHEGDEKQEAGKEGRPMWGVCCCIAGGPHIVTSQLIAWRQRGGEFIYQLSLVFHQQLNNAAPGTFPPLLGRVIFLTRRPLEHPASMDISLLEGRRGSWHHAQAPRSRGSQHEWPVQDSAVARMTPVRRKQENQPRVAHKWTLVNN